LAGNEQLKRRLGWLEAALFALGIALLAVYFQVRASSEDQRAESVEAFLAANGSEAPAPVTTVGEGLFSSIQSPDQELWSDKRKADYAASLKASTDLPMAVLTIDHLGIQVPVYDGADDFNLNRGVARIRGTGQVGGEGNLGIAGHRDGFFRALKDISLDDEIQLQTPNGLETFHVTSIDIVNPDDVSVLAPTEESSITLVTCYPFYYVGHAPKRFIVKAEAEHLVVLN
jgi:sortase A